MSILPWQNRLTRNNQYVSYSVLALRGRNTTLHSTMPKKKKKKKRDTETWDDHIRWRIRGSNELLSWLLVCRRWPPHHAHCPSHTSPEEVVCSKRQLPYSRVRKTIEIAWNDIGLGTKWLIKEKRIHILNGTSSNMLTFLTVNWFRRIPIWAVIWVLTGVILRYRSP